MSRSEERLQSRVTQEGAGPQGKRIVELFDRHGVRATLIEPTAEVLSNVLHALKHDADRILHKDVTEQDAEAAEQQRAAVDAEAQQERAAAAPPAPAGPAVTTSAG